MLRTIALPLAFCLTLLGQTPNPALLDVPDEAGLPRVLLIGDSISIGYTVPVRDLLRGKANVHRVPANGGPTTNGLAHLTSWLGEGKWDAIHFNWGLHDLKIGEDGRRQVPLDEYEKNLRELVAKLKQTRARLIFATTTPVPEGNVNPPRVNADVIRYNAAAAKIMLENSIAIDDLYGFVGPRQSTIQLPANVHFTEDGYREVARKVADSIFP